MRVLLLADGRSAHTIRFQNELAKQGVDLILASLERGETVDIRLKKKSVSNSLNYFFVNREIKDLVRRVTPDIVNPHFASGYGFSVALSGVWKKRPVALHCLGSDILLSPRKSFAHKRKVTYALSKVTHLFVDSRYLAGKVQELYPVKNIDIIPWGVEQEIADLYEKRANSFAREKPLRVFVPRPHNKVYNNIFIIKSLRHFIDRREIALTFPNWGDECDAFKRAAQAECPGSLIDYYDFIPREEYIRFIARFDIYLSASLSDSSPASLIEAMASGLFPVVADIPGVREWIDDESAILFDPRDGKALSDAIQRLLNSGMDFKRALASNHAKVRKDGLFSENIKKTIRIMEAMVGHDS